MPLDGVGEGDESKERLIFSSKAVLLTGSGIRCFFNPWIRNLGWVKSQELGNHLFDADPG
jgi:hypothetical protein